MSEKAAFFILNLLANFYRVLPNFLRKLYAHKLTILVLLLARDRMQTLVENINLCSPSLKSKFPLKSDFSTRYKITYYHAMVLIDYFSAFSMGEEEIKNTVKVVGLEHLENKSPDETNGVIIYFPHFIGISMGSWLTTRIFKSSLIYSPPKQKIIAKWLNKVYQEEIPQRTYSKNNSILPLAKILKNGGIIQLSTDLDVGEKDALIVNFCQVPTFTSKALPFFINKYRPKLIGAVCTYIDEDKQNSSHRYQLTLSPIPINSAALNTVNLEDKYKLIQEELHQWLEAKIAENPYQYWWFHKRFKTAKRLGLIATKK